MAELILTDEYGFLGGIGGSCALCNASKRTTDRPERIITTNLMTDMPNDQGIWPEKYLEFCETCVVEMGHLVGMADEKEVLNRDLIIAEQENTIAGQAEDLATLRKEIQAFSVIQKYIKQPVVDMPDVVAADPRGTTGRRK